MKDNNEFASAGLTAGQLNAIVKKLGGHEAALAFLRGELIVSGPVRKWQEKDGVITFTVTSDGTTGPEWIKRLEKGGFRVGDYAKQLLKKMDTTDGVTTDGVTTDVTVLKGELFSDNDRVTSKIRAEAESRGLTEPNPEIACLIRELFTDKELEEMGVWSMVAMHEPIEDADGNPSLLGASRSGGGRWLGACYGEPDSEWGRGSSFAFAAQV